MQIFKGVQKTALKVVIYGPEGIGKSTFASQLPDPVFLDTEGSTKHMDVARLEKPTSWAMLLEQVQWIRDHPETCQTLVLDTADWAEQLCAAELCAKNQKSGIEDFGYGKGYTYLGEEFGRLLNRLEEVVKRGIHVAVTAHAKMRKFEQPDEMGAYDRWELKLSKTTAPMVKEWADMVLFANYKTFAVKTKEGKVKAQGGSRVMYTSHHPCWDAKNRQNLPDELPFDFEAIRACFAGGAADPAPAPVSSPPVRPSTPSTQPPTNAPTAAPGSTEQNEPAGACNYDALQAQLPAYFKPLLDLMRQGNVTPEEIEATAVSKGHWPQGTRFQNMTEDYVSGYLVGVWDKVLMYILDNRPLPF